MDHPSLPDFIIFDLETTGRDPVVHEIIEIGALRVSPDAQTIRAELNLRVRPLHPELAEPAATAVNGYSAEGWHDAIPLSDAISQLKEFSVGGMFAGYNVAFDWACLTKAFDITTLPEPWPFDYHVFDVFSVAYQYAQSSNLNLDNWRLSTFCEHFKIPVPPKPHRALSDAKRTLELLRALKVG